ncbi:UNVERIFIED_ORG: NodT family efflux transporter outer membrane factor (OMF) lipoprotein [Zoogloea ramigera]|uniref:Efflux transporter outer membrane subunit n=1 Tax=Duganella zoogloeoides TaxID=75659 RepID=A0ABZ0XTE0_9BURK|nr:efflux transporter outer membrane subunit [Duganella zoogloeoides]WQH02674.1 efflux transporter outer membrane subunit [Duganella zoogloeoides]
MIPTRPLIALAAACIVTGCATAPAVGPDYARPDLQLPQRYLAQSAEPVGDLSAWWRGFDDRQLDQLVTLALAQNLDLAQASARVAQARAGLGAAQAALLPSANVNAQAARAYQSVETPLGQVANAQPGFDRYGSAYEANIGAGWEIDLFGGLRRGREAALAEYQASAAGAAATRLAVAAQTADTYITLRGLQARLEVARKQVRTQEGLLATLNLLLGKGLVPELQVRQVEGALAQVRSSVPVLEAAQDTAMNALDVMLGSAPGTHRAQLLAASAIPVAPAITATGTPGDLLRRRPDLIVAERRLAASHARIGVAIAEFYPKFSLSGMIGSATAISGGNLFTNDASQASAMLGLRWRLFDFGRINAQIDQARGQEAEALAAYRQSALRATADVENALTDMQQRHRQAATLEQGVQAWQQARQASFAAYQKGVVSLIEVLQADDKLLQASDMRVQAQAEAARAAVAAFKALGGGWQPAQNDGAVAALARR